MYRQGCNVRCENSNFVVRVQPVYLDEGEPGLKDQAETGVMGPVGEDVSEQCVQPRPWKWKSDGHS